MKCYVCHKKITKMNTHPFYRRMCIECGNSNWEKRQELVSLSGYTALVTGGRIKIGYETSLKLLRSGAFVVVTTRFPVDAVHRYSDEEDFQEWSTRLIVYQIDFRQIQNIYGLINFMYNSFDHLDILINNAAQTVRHPIDYYTDLLETEKNGYDKLPDNLKKLIVHQVNSECFTELQKTFDGMVNFKTMQNKPVLYKNENLTKSFQVEDCKVRGMQIYNKSDIQKHNSWIAKACDISLIEMLEVQLINVTTPFVLCTELRNLMECSPNRYKHIVNVSAMEGKFSKPNKNCFHPHTNMAKASLNMLTRTSAQDFFESGIIMNSVDTGWITDENPDWIKEKNKKKGLTLPLDSRDGASRLCDPIFSSLIRNDIKYGVFYKNYKQTEW